MLFRNIFLPMHHKFLINTRSHESNVRHLKTNNISSAIHKCKRIVMSRESSSRHSLLSRVFTTVYFYCSWSGQGNRWALSLLTKAAAQRQQKPSPPPGSVRVSRVNGHRGTRRFLGRVPSRGKSPLTQPPGPPLPEAPSTARPRPRPVASGLAQRLPPSGRERSTPGGGASAALWLRCPSWAFRGPAPGVARRRLEPGPRPLPLSPSHLLRLPRRAGAGHVGVRVRELAILHVSLQAPRLQRHLAAAVPESGVGARRRAGTAPLPAHQWGERAAVTSRAVRVGSAGGRAGGWEGEAGVSPSCQRVGGWCCRGRVSSRPPGVCSRCGCVGGWCCANMMFRWDPAPVCFTARPCAPVTAAAKGAAQGTGRGVAATRRLGLQQQNAN